MKLAIPFEDGAVFEHFDRAAQFCIYTAADYRVQDSILLPAAGLSHQALALMLRQSGVDVVLCNQIAEEAALALEAAGLSVHNGITGTADGAAAAYLAGMRAFGAPMDPPKREVPPAPCGGCCQEGNSSGCGGCGSCQSGEPAESDPNRVFTDIIPLISDNFRKEVLDDAALICIDFWAPWCAPCKEMAPAFEAANAEQPRVKFCTVNADEAPELARLFGIENIPTMVLVRDKRTLTGLVGAHSKEAINDLIAEYL